MAQIEIGRSAEEMGQEGRHLTAVIPKPGSIVNAMGVAVAESVVHISQYRNSRTPLHQRELQGTVVGVGDVHELGHKAEGTRTSTQIEHTVAIGSSRGRRVTRVDVLQTSKPVRGTPDIGRFQSQLSCEFMLNAEIVLIGIRSL